MRRLALGIGLVVALTAPAWVWNPYHLHTLIMAGIFAVLALSLNLLLGYTGQLSLGHAAFFGIGAYASALLSVKLEWSPWLGLLAAIVLPGVAGYVIGRLALKLRGAYFVLLTISFAGCVSLVSVNWMDLTNGPLGIPGVPPVEIALPGLAALVAADQERLLLPGAGRGGRWPTCCAWPSSARGSAAPWWRCGRTRPSPPRWASTPRTTWCWPRWRAPRWPASRAASTRTTRASSARRSSSSPTPSRW